MGHYKKYRFLSIALIAPSAIALLVFVYGFIGFTAMASMINWTKMKIDFTFVGLNNYIRLFNNQRFIIGLTNTFTFTLLFLIVTIVIGFLLAVAVDRNVKGESIFRNIYLFPMAISFIVSGVVWRWLLNPGNATTGYLGVNMILEKIGLGFLANGWYTDPHIGIRAVVIAAVWQYAVMLWHYT
jgi:glucose/mannose transport system permease protein